MRHVIRDKISDAVEAPLPALTHRDAQLPSLPRRAHAIIGMRRSGKTCFLHQQLRERLDSGVPRTALIYFSFEDERIAGMRAADLGLILEEYFALFPKHRDHQRVTFFFDEIQTVPGWELFIRRILDSENLDIFVSGSSAKMLSREVATSLRGRATETIIFPFSFREFLRNRGEDVSGDVSSFPKARRSAMENLYRIYLAEGGFPEAAGSSPDERRSLLQSYVDSVILRDVVERHGVANVTALRRLIRQLLANPAGEFSVNRFYNDLQSQGVAAAKDTIHAMLSHLEDAFLIRLVNIEAESERKRQSNPRKVYPVDPAFVHAFDRSGKANLGRTLETAVAIELERRGYSCTYVRTPGGYEIDFLARSPFGNLELIQVCADLSAEDTRLREFRAMEAARTSGLQYPALLLTMAGIDAIRAQAEAPKGVTVKSAWQWALSPVEEPKRTRKK